MSKPLNKISKIPWKTLLAFLRGVHMPNFSSLASKLWEELELMDRMDGQTTFSPADPL